MIYILKTGEPFEREVVTHVTTDILEIIDAALYVVEVEKMWNRLVIESWPVSSSIPNVGPTECVTIAYKKFFVSESEDSIVLKGLRKIILEHGTKEQNKCLEKIDLKRP